MHKAIPKMAQPAWLARQTAETMVHEPLPLKEILDDSLFYAVAGSDTMPVEIFAGNVCSFVYSGSHYTRREVLGRLQSQRAWFRGYRLVGIREMKLKEVFPRGCYSRIDLVRTMRFLHKQESWGNFTEHPLRPFALWAVFEQEIGGGMSDISDRFSLFLVCFESIATYAGLYIQNDVLPKILYLVNNGSGMDSTDLEDTEYYFAMIVGRHPRGIPDWLVGRSSRKTRDCARIEEARSDWFPHYPGAPVAAAGDGRGFMIWRRHPNSVRK